MTGRVQSTAVVGAAFRRLISEDYSASDDPESVSLGVDVWIGHFAVVGTGCRVGDRSILDDFCLVQSDAEIGSDTLVTHRAMVCSDAVVGSNCVIGGFIGDRSRVGHGVRVFGKLIHLQHNPSIPWDAAEAREGAPWLEDGCFVGFDAKVIGPVRIGQRAYVAANALVTRDVPDHHIAVGVNEFTSIDRWRGRLTWKS